MRAELNPFPGHLRKPSSKSWLTMPREVAWTPMHSITQLMWYWNEITMNHCRIIHNWDSFENDYLGLPLPVNSIVRGRKKWIPRPLRTHIHSQWNNSTQGSLYCDILRHLHKSWEFLKGSWISQIRHFKWDSFENRRRRNIRRASFTSDATTHEEQKKEWQFPNNVDKTIQGMPPRLVNKDGKWKLKFEAGAEKISGIASFPPWNFFFCFVSMNSSSRSSNGERNLCLRLKRSSSTGRKERNEGKDDERQFKVSAEFSIHSICFD